MGYDAGNGPVKERPRGQVFEALNELNEEIQKLSVLTGIVADRTDQVRYAPPTPPTGALGSRVAESEVSRSGCDAFHRIQSMIDNVRGAQRVAQNTLDTLQI